MKYEPEYEDPWDTLVVMARAIVRKNHEVEHLRAENERLQDIERTYHKHLNDSIKHGDVMMRNLLGVCLENASKSA